MRRGAALALVVAATLAGCSEFDPYATLPRAAEPQQPQGERVGICYNRLTATPADVKAQAQPQCPAGTEAQRVDTDWYLQSCPLLLPARATFVCVAQKK